MTEPLALVTGTTGFIAARLVPALLADGFRVRATGRRPRPDDLPEEVEYQAADLAGDDFRTLGSLCAGVTHVFHLAGASSSKSTQEEMERNNIDATQLDLRVERRGQRGDLPGRTSVQVGRQDDLGFRYQVRACGHRVPPLPLPYQRSWGFPRYGGGPGYARRAGSPVTTIRRRRAPPGRRSPARR